jgi:ABC-type lipoprotein release transport system permease subunit
MNSAVGYWARRIIRRDAGAIALLVLVVVVAAGGAMAAAAGARRSVTAADRLMAVSDVPEAVVIASGEENFAAVTDGPDVAGAVLHRQLGLQPGASCDDDSYYPIVVPVAGERFAIPKPTAVRGRLSDPAAANEAVLSETHARRLGVEVGDRVELRAHELDETGEITGCSVTPVADVEVVGIIRELFEIGAVDDEGALAFTYLTPAFIAAHPDVPDLSEQFGLQGFVDLAPGVRTTEYIDEMDEGVPGGADGEPLVFGFPVPFSNPVQPALDATGVGLWVLAGVTAAVGLVALAVGFARQLASAAEDLKGLAALGLGRRQVAVAAATPAIVVAIIGIPVAVLLAAALSTVHLVGMARVAEPDPGFDLDPVVLVVGVAVSLVVIAGLAGRLSWQAAKRATRPSRSRALRRPGVAGAVAGRGAPPWAALGVGYAVGDSRTAGLPSRGAAIGAIAGAAGLLAVLVFGLGVSHASSDPAVYGWGDWDGFVSVPDESDGDAIAAALQDPDVAAVAEVEFRFKLRVAGELASGVAVRQHGGQAWPTIVDGRPPRGADEIALGADLLELLGVTVGDRVAVDGPDRQQTDAKVVGTFALPSYDSDPIGGAWLADRALLDALGWPAGCNEDSECFEPVAFEVREGVAAGTVRDRLAERGLDVEPPVPGAEVRLLGEVDTIPAVAAVVVAVLAAIGLAHTLAVTRRRRRRDLAVARALGFVRGQVRRVLYVEGLTLGTIGAVAGAAVGVVIGRVAWQQAARAIGIGADLPPIGGIVLSIQLGVVAVAVLLSVVPAHRAARAAAAEGLRDER